MKPPPKLQEFYRYPVTSGTIVLAVVVTLGWWAEMNVDPLLIDASVVDGEWWRFLSSTLAHADPIHLLFNLYWVWIFGSVVEQNFGDLRTAALFVTLALGSSAAEFAFFSGGVGLSGVGYGLFGLFWVLNKKDPRFWGTMSQSTVYIFVGWFFFCILATQLNILQIGNVAHGSGAILGAVVAMAVAKKGTQRHLWAAGYAALILVFVALATVLWPAVNLVY